MPLRENLATLYKSGFSSNTPEILLLEEILRKLDALLQSKPEGPNSGLPTVVVASDQNGHDWKQCLHCNPSQWSPVIAKRCCECGEPFPEKFVVKRDDQSIQR